MSHIYKILNLRNEKFYIGSTNNFKKRKYTHFSQLKKNAHPNKHLQRAWNKYGEENFEFIILEEVNDEDQFEIEQKYIDELQPFDENGYNISRNVNNPFNRIYELTCRECIEPFLSYNKKQIVCSDECKENYDINEWRRSEYWYKKNLDDWTVDDHLAAYCDDMMEK